MKAFDVYVEATSWISVEAETAEEAKEAALDIFSVHTVDSIEATVMHESEID